ncbi:hypothetical protein [Metabacillus schmidteae]|uniref:hypothetical protein n=1 Tax=Metabacillus schmidteae TaxID=2730405 RepID=UPI0015885A16|nr:hypothetical protein [Metabacillus schmidteae]
MKRMPFEPPTDHYDKRVFSIDERLCVLLKERKEISNNNPGFPPLEDIQQWSEKYDLYEDLLRAIFGTIENDDHFRPQIEPTDFVRYIPVSKSVIIDDTIYSAVFIRQYKNASVINFNIDWEPNEDSLDERFHRQCFWDLYIGEEYDSRITGGSGTDGHLSYNFIVSPPISDDVSNLKLIFKEYKMPIKKNSAALEVVMEINL